MADILPEKWMKGVAITTTVLAVMTSIASSRASYCVAKNQVLTALEGSKWAYYQAKSIKQNLLESERKMFEVNLLSASTEELKARISGEISEAGTTISRYEQEKGDIRKEAEAVGKENMVVGRRGNQFSMSVVFFQIGIMLSSVSALLKRKELWYIGLAFGCVAIVLLANAFLLLW